MQQESKSVCLMEGGREGGREGGMGGTLTRQLLTVWVQGWEESRTNARAFPLSFPITCRTMLYCRQATGNRRNWAQHYHHGIMPSCQLASVCLNKPHGTMDRGLYSATHSSHSVCPQVRSCSRAVGQWSLPFCGFSHPCMPSSAILA